MRKNIEDIQLDNRLKTLVTIFRSVELDEEKINCGLCINKSFRDFLTFNLNYIAKEEWEINQALWKHYSDEELLQLNARLTASIPPEEKLISAKWMLRSIISQPLKSRFRI